MSLAFVEPSTRPAALQARLADAVSLVYIGHRLGHPARSLKWLATRVDWLTAHAGFPAPLPSPAVRDRRYSRRAVDQWFDAHLPPGCPSCSGNTNPMAAILDARAAGLHQLGPGA